MRNERNTSTRRTFDNPESVKTETSLGCDDDIELDPAFDESEAEDEDDEDCDDEEDEDQEESDAGEDEEEEGEGEYEYDDDEIDYGDFSEYSEDSETRPVTSIPNVLDFEFENGRRYHSYKKGKYALPNDETEQERLDMMHHLYLLLRNGELTFAPIGPDTKKVLDIGTGTGIWAIDFADAHPEAQVVGTDLSPIQPPFVPPNLHFEVDDAESESAYDGETETYDFIHIRHLAASIRDWPGLIKRAYAHLRPNGYLEIVEHDLNAHSNDNTLPPTCALYRYLQNLRSISTSQDCIGWSSLHLFKTWIIEAGFVDVDEEIHKVPWGPWSTDKKEKELGKMTQVIVETGMEAYALAFLTRTKFSEHEARELIAEAKLDLKGGAMHVWNLHGFFIGRKPATTYPREGSENEGSDDGNEPENRSSHKSVSRSSTGGESKAENKTNERI